MKEFASCFVNAPVSKGSAVPPETLEGIKDTSLQSVQQMRASIGTQPRASRLSVPTFSTKVQLRPPSQSLPAFTIFRKTTSDIVRNRAGKQILPEGAKFLAILPSNANNGGEDDGAWELVHDKNPHKPSQEVHWQTWGIPWSPEQFVHQAVKAGHPMLLQACLPPLLKELVRKYHTTSTLDRVQHRSSRVEHWMARAKQLEELDQRRRFFLSECCMAQRFVVRAVALLFFLTA